MQCARSVMLRDKIYYSFRQTHFACELLTVGDVGDDDLGALRRFQSVMRIFNADLIFNKMFGRRRLPDVVIERADTRQESITADDTTCFLGKLANRMRMLVGARCTNSKLAKNRKICIGQ